MPTSLAARALALPTARAAPASSMPALRAMPAPAALKPRALQIATYKQLVGGMALDSKLGARTCLPTPRGTAASRVVAMAQCQGTTQKGHQCKRSAGSNGHCAQHGG